MSQVSSQSVANGAGSAVRAAINSLFAALFSSNSGPSAPSPTVAGMWWFDTTNLIMKRRNNANTAWIDVSLETLAANTLRGNPTGSAAVEQEVTMAQLRAMLGFSQSLASNGYVVLPGGVIVQWGTIASGAAGTTVTFPITFTTTNYGLTVTIVTPSAVLTAMTDSLAAGSFGLRTRDTAGAIQNVGVRWLAIGY